MSERVRVWRVTGHVTVTGGNEGEIAEKAEDKARCRE